MEFGAVVAPHPADVITAAAVPKNDRRDCNMVLGFTG